MTYWWVAGRGVQDLGGWESGLDSTGRLTGLLASDLLLAQVLLMARVSILEHAFGQDRLAQLHRFVGFTSFNLMLAHVMLIVGGYAGGRASELPSALWETTLDDPGMLLAVAGAGCLVLVVVTSLRWARARLRYESWHLLHLYAYIGAGLALPHQLWTGQELLASRGATIYWWGAWGAVAATAVTCRLLLPFWRSARHRLQVTEVVAEGGGLFSVHMTGRNLRRLRTEAGQFFIWRFLGSEGRSRGNPYSLSAAPDGRSLRVTIKDLGPRNSRLRELAPGTRVLFEGPFGRLSDRSRTRDRVAFIGAGVGTTPLRALAEGLDYRPGDAVFLQRYRDEPLFVDELVALAEGRGLELLWVGGRRRAADSWLGPHVGDVDDRAALTYWIPDIARRDVFVCGPQEWTRLVLLTLAEAGVKPRQIHIESFSW